MLKPQTRSLLLVLPWSPNLPGGVSVVVRNLYNTVGSQWLRPIIMVTTWEATHLQSDAEGTQSFRFAILVGSSWLSLVKSVLLLPLRLWRTLGVLREHRVDAVNFHYPNLDALGVAVLKKMGLFRGRLTLSFHGTDVRIQGNSREDFLWQFVFKMADGISACSAALAERIANTFNIEKVRIRVIYNGVDCNLFRPDAGREERDSSIPEPFIVSVGSYIPRKGHRVLLEAFALLAMDFPNVALVIAGLDGAERLFLEARAKQLDLTERIKCLVGLSPIRVASLVARAEVCVQPSYEEPFGLAVIEAGASGVPVIATAVGGHLELLRHEETGFLFAAGDANQCSTLLREVFNAPENAKVIANRLRAEVVEKFTWDICSRGYLALNTTVRDL